MKPGPPMPCEQCEQTNKAPTPTCVRSFAESLPRPPKPNAPTPQHYPRPRHPPPPSPDDARRQACDRKYISLSWAVGLWGRRRDRRPGGRGVFGVGQRGDVVWFLGVVRVFFGCFRFNWLVWVFLRSYVFFEFEQQRRLKRWVSERGAIAAGAEHRGHLRCTRRCDASGNGRRV
jgi:hypothetical protein